LSSRISAARRAIGDTGEDQRLIRTLHKRGFRFVGQIEELMPTVSDAPPSAPAADPKMEASAPALALPDKPSIAVLPFQNMSGDAEQDYFADGLTEDIITGLSRQRWFFVIARNSTFAYKGEAVDVRKVASQLGVRYVLEGSVRKAAGTVRVTGQLIDASNGAHLWADKYDRELANVFELQDEITNRVIGSVGPQILVVEAARVRRKPPQSIDAWDLVLQALPHMWRMSADAQRRAQELLQRAVAIDADYAHAHALLGWTHISMFNLGSSAIGAFTDRAIEAGRKAVSLDDQEPWGHLVLGLGHARRRHPERAISHLSESVNLNPNFALGYAGLGYGLACGGQPENGLRSLEQAERLSPRDPFLANYGPIVRYMALFALERYEEAVAVCRATTALNPNHVGAWRLMTVSLALLGQVEEAKEALARTLALQPDLTTAHVEKNTVYADPADRARFLLGLRRAGLKD
jgi:TolB-like protein/Flp pilus assembly protein TadD